MDERGRQVCAEPIVGRRASAIYCSKRCANRAGMAAFLERNPGYRSEYGQSYYAKNRSRMRKAQGDRYATDPAHREAAKARACARTAADPAANAARATAWNRAHPDWRRQITRRWGQTHPENRRVNDSRRRARKGGNGGAHTVEMWLWLLADFASRCAYCGEPAPEKDHVLPMALGGGDDVGNLLPACRWCNRSKGHQDRSRGSPEPSRCRRRRSTRRSGCSPSPTSSTTTCSALPSEPPRR